MAIIYDLCTGKVITEHQVISRNERQIHPVQAAAGLQTMHSTGNPETTDACSAYMVLLQRVLKDL
jgi:hypothetical protein